MQWHNKKSNSFFLQNKFELTTPYARKHKTPTSGFIGDFLLKDIFLKLFCNETIKEKGTSVIIQK